MFRLDLVHLLFCSCHNCQACADLWRNINLFRWHFVTQIVMLNLLSLSIRKTFYLLGILFNRITYFCRNSISACQCCVMAWVVWRVASKLKNAAFGLFHENSNSLVTSLVSVKDFICYHQGSH